MPRFKQPDSIKKMAMKILVEYFIRFFENCNRTKSFDALREGVTFIKNEMRPQLPATLAVELYNSSVREFARTSRNRGCIRIAAELLMDDRITGIKLTSEIMFSLDLEDLARIRGVTEIQLSDKIPHSLSLECLDLKDLTAFEYNIYCTDEDLAPLSKHCAKLERVSVFGSFYLTDLGLHYLAECPNLRSLSVAGCFRVSMSGLIRFLSVNKTIRELSAGPDFFDRPGFDVCRIRNWDLDPSVYRSIESLKVEEDLSDRHLLAIVAKFPGLRSITLRGTIEGNLSVLESLSKLSEIHLHWRTRLDWAVFESFLERVGPRIRRLILSYNELDVDDKQRRLKSIYRLCENLEFLEFAWRIEFGRGQLVVPPFEKLQTLNLRHISASLSFDDRVMMIGFGQMLMLETLVLEGFHIDESQLESIILDHASFPNLKYIKLPNFHFRENYRYIEQLAIRNNLDLVFGNCAG